MSGPATQDFDLYRGNTYDLVFTLTSVPVGGIAGWTTVLSFWESEDDAAAVLECNGTVTDADAGEITVRVTRADLLTLRPRGYDYGLNRTNSGSEDCLAVGRVIVKLNRRDAK